MSVADASDAGRTEQTTYTQFQIANGKFDRAEMISALADLQDDANAFISLATAADDNAVAILHRDADDELPPAARRFKGRFKGLLDTFQSSLEPYKDTADTFINFHAAVSALANVNDWEEVVEQDRGSEALFQLANVAILLNMTLHGRAASSLDFINTTFPTEFFTDFSTSWGSALSDKTVELALGLRTQYFMDLLYRKLNQPDFEPDYILQSVFFNEEGRLLAFELKGDDGDMQHSCQPLFEQRIQDIRQHFSTEEPYVNIETLEASFPWPAFHSELVQWAAMRGNGLNMQISNRGGAKALQIHYLGGPPAAPISEKKRKSVGDKARQVNEMLAVVQANKARRETLNAQREVLGNAQVQEIQESPIQTGAYEPATNDAGIDDGSFLASQQSQQVLETLRLHAAQSNKENLQAGRKGKSVDRQAEAQTFDDSQFVNGEPGPSRKRGREVDAEDDASSIQYEEDTRPQSTKRIRNNVAHDDLAEAAVQFAANAQLLSHAASPSQPLPVRRALTPRQRRDQPPASTAPELDRQLQSPLQSIPGSQPVAGPRNKGPQVRVPFSVEENTRLLELITSLPEGTMRISWAQLEKEDLRHPEGPLLQARGQVGLKDKARNLKMDFLK